jgi:hypothetical protein
MFSVGCRPIRDPVNGEFRHLAPADILDPYNAGQCGNAGREWNPGMRGDDSCYLVV